ncbi:MAG: hypothetical protein ACK5BL_08250 [Flavobacteriales bacterium]|jgi:hypothetical protein
MTPHLILLMLEVLAIGALVSIIIYLFNAWIKHRERSWVFILKQDNNKALAPLRISAYERIIVMLERTTPQAMVMRLSATATHAAYLHMDLTKALREEFEHNISLQMYVSDECWNKIKRAKEETGELYKVAFTRVRAESSSAEYAREILHLEATVGNSAIREAIVAVRAEMAKHF